ncbi:MAG: WD40 repeat domain-containing protein [Pirellulales bacterium]
MPSIVTASVVLLVTALFAGGCGRPPQDATPVAVIPVAGASVGYVAADPSGHRVAIRREWGGGLVLTLPNGENAGVSANLLKDASRFSFSPTGDRLAIGGSAGARVWDFGSNSVVRTFGALGECASVVFAPTGDALFFASEDPDASVWRCDLQTGEAKVLFRDRDERTLSRDFSPRMQSLAMAPDNKTLAIGLGGGTVLFDIPSASCKFALKSQGGAGNAAFSPDGGIFARGANGLFELWDSRNGRRLGEYRATATAIAFSRNSDYILIAGDGHTPGPNYIDVVRLKDLQLVRRTYCHDDAIAGVAFLPGSRVMSASIEGTIKIWNLKDLAAP